MQAAQLAATIRQGMDIQVREPATREKAQQRGAGGVFPNAALRPAAKYLQQKVNATMPAPLVFNWQSRHFMMENEPRWLLNQINEILAENEHVDPD